jgi:formylglycine-generating enzyme required for sulfatase activity
MRMLKVLAAIGPSVLGESKRLRSFLCPVVAQNVRQQERFYEVFDQFWKEIREEEIQLQSRATSGSGKRIYRWLSSLIIGAIMRFLHSGKRIYGGVRSLIIWAVRVPPPSEKKKRPWWLQLLIILAILAVPFLLQLIYYDPVKSRFDEHLTPVQIGDTLKMEGPGLFESTTKDDSYHWEIKDPDLDTVFFQSEDPVLIWPVIALEGTPIKMINLEIIKDGDTLSYGTNLEIHCSDPPAGLQINGPDFASPNEAATFVIRGVKDPGWQYRWRLGDSLVSTDTFLTQPFGTKPNSVIQLEVIDTTEGGVCDTLLEYHLRKAYVPYQAKKMAYVPYQVLQKDPVYTQLVPGPGIYLILAILLLLSILCGILWWRRRHKNKGLRTRFENEALAERFAAPDKAPYTIPFASRNAWIKTDTGLFRLADLLRERQAGERQLLDVPASIRHTLQKGGFPELRMRSSSRPTEYLFLIDQGEAESHQTALFDFLLQFLADKDVDYERFYYQQSFDRFFNESHPKGLSLQQLSGRYPTHRLIVIGQAHELLDPFSIGKARLKPQLAGAFRHWKSRTLLTPVPLASWTYREQLLYEEFFVFPADIDGYREALYVVETLDEEDFRPTFEEWKKALAISHQHPDIRERFWRRLDTYKDYLQLSSPLYQWFCALAVCPEPRWELTIAIGKALAPKGVEVTFDHLLVLSRIPALQEGAWNPGLRQKLLEELKQYPETARLAREALLRELKEVEVLTADSHVNFAVQSQLATQELLLEPDDPGHRKVMQYLLQEDALSKSDQGELLRGLGKPVPRESERRLERLQTVLEEVPSGLRLRNPWAFWTPFFFALFLLGVEMIGLYNDPAILEYWFPEKPAFFVEDVVKQDSAAIYNNRGVDIWLDIAMNTDPSLRRGVMKANQYFRKADSLREGRYQIARENLEDLQYNYAVALYHRGVDPLYTALLSDAQAFVGDYRTDVMRGLDKRHLTGLASLYKNETDLAREQYAFLDSLGYFDTLEVYPNLEVLLLEGVDTIVNIPIPEMIFVEGGTFTMGCTEEKANGCDDNEYPPHEVSVPDFYIGKYEVTNQEFAAFLNAEGNQKEEGRTWYDTDSESARIKFDSEKKSYFVESGYDGHPVEGVNWYGAYAYCQWLSEQTGLQYRLPSEAIWEFAARGGIKSKAYKYSGGDGIDSVAVYDENSGGGPVVVGSKKPNELGLYGMSGNASEWCQDPWHEDYKGAPTDGSSWDTGGDPSRRVVRGGSWRYDGYDCRVSGRIGVHAVIWDSSLGFRVARY